MSNEHIKALTARLGTKSGEPTGHPVRRSAAREGFLLIPIALIRPDPNQPRKHFDKRDLDDLTASVLEKGILQPVLVRPDGEGFMLIDGERRFRAATAAGLKEMPALVRLEEDAREVALIANLQRENLTPLEEAEAFAALRRERGFTQDVLAKIVGKSRVSVTESLSLNQLPEVIKAECRTSDMWSKSQLLQVLRAGSERKVLDAWTALKAGGLRTVRDLRRAKGIGKRPPRRYQFEHAPKGRTYWVTVAFAKRTATRREVEGALKDAIRNVRRSHA